MKALGEKGIALIVVIVIVVITAIIILGIASFISNALALATAKSSMEGALFAAQAGIYAAIYDYLAVPSARYWTKTANVNITGNKYYSVGKDANFLLVNAFNPQISNKVLQAVPLSNINQTQAITVKQMIVEWTGLSGSTRLNQVYLGGTRRWNSSVSSGQLLTLSPQFQMNATVVYSGTTQNRWIFSVNLPTNATVIVTFIFTDGSSRKTYLLNEGHGGNNEFSITATGAVRGTTNWRRSIEATYDVTVGKITSWQEVGSHI